MLRRVAIAAAAALSLLPAAAARADDTTPPHTTITQLPGTPYASTDPYTHSRVSWPDDAVTYFQADEPATFECRDWDSDWAPCTSPVTRPTLPTGIGGEHLFIRATDLAGNVEQTPAHTFWSIDSPKAVVPASETGVYKVGQQLTCDGGQWPTALLTPLRKEFHRNNETSTATVGTGDTYTVTPADVGSQIHCEIDLYDSPFGWHYTTQTNELPARYQHLPSGPHCGGAHRVTGSDGATDVTLGGDCGLTVTSDDRGFYLDTDGDAATGDPAHGGADRYLRFASGAAILAYWSGGDFLEAAVLPSSDAGHGRTTWKATGDQLGLKPAGTLTVTVRGAGGSVVALDVTTTDQPQADDPEPAPTATPTPTATPVPGGGDRAVLAVKLRPARAVNVKKPALSGTAKAGYRLRCAPGAWKGATRLAYAWTRDGKRIKGETGRAYTVRRTDRGHRIGCTVSAAAAGGTKSVAARAVKVRR
jgi:hypothetical protein